MNHHLSNLVKALQNHGPIVIINDEICQILSKYDMLSFAANGRISGPPVFRTFTPLEAISGPRDLEKMKDLDETHLLVNFHQISTKI